MDYLQIRELYHDGIKGMKWGIRRYQNYDGTLTEEGRLRYNKNYSEGRAEGSLPTKDKDGNYYYTNKEGKKTLYKTRSEQLSDTELTDLNKRVQQENKLASETSDAYEYKGPKADQALRDASRMAKDIADALPKGNGKVIKKDYSYLSDQELRDRINRLQLEDNYGRLTGDTKYVKSGSEKTREMLQTVGSVLAIAGSAVGLAYTIRKMREDNNTNTAKHSDILDENENTLKHYGIEGQKWGLRRYQNDDGTLTEAGRLRYGGKTHVSELDEDELNDLHADREYQHKKKLAIGIGLGVGAAAAITAGATWLAIRSQQRTNTLNQQNRQNDRNVAELIDILDSKPSASRTNKGTVIDAVFKDVKKTDYHMHQPDKVKPNLFSLPAPKPTKSKPSYNHRNVAADKVKPNLFSLPAPKPTKSKPSYNHRNVAAGVFDNDKIKYSKYEYFKDHRGVAHKILKSELRASPRIHINHFDSSDYLIFREAYFSSFDTLAHHGIKGQKWGVRRYQDQNGTLTSEGKERYRTNQGTKEIIGNSDTYSKLVGPNKRQYVNYGKSSGAKRGFLIGLGTGAAAGAGKTIFETVVNRNKLGSGEFTTNRVINRFIRNTMIGAFGGSVIGTLYGSVAGKKSAQAKLADKGQAYTNELLNTPIDRIARRR